MYFITNQEELCFCCNEYLRNTMDSTQRKPQQQGCGCLKKQKLETYDVLCREALGA